MIQEKLFEFIGEQRYRSKALSAKQLCDVNHSQSKIQGFDLNILQNSKILLVGAGGLGGPIAFQLNLKGANQVIVDFDVVTPGNLCRQFFKPKDIGKKKAPTLAKNITEYGAFKTKVIALDARFQELKEEGFELSQFDLIVGAVDNNPTRIDITKAGIKHGIPIIQTAVSPKGSRLYCFVQEPGSACLGCALDWTASDDSYPCNLGGIADVLFVAAGIVVYAIDSVLSGRLRTWNLRTIDISGALSDTIEMIEKRPDCKVCGQLNN